MPTNQISKHTEDEKLQAAYALNMCTVSMSQIIDYNDIYILEQEYEAILNNLNLEKMPKDEALLTILTEILNTISFFRIQEIKKDQIEKKYQNDMRSAIWHAIPNPSVIVSGNPVALGISIATQIGTGYMNYRNAKAQANSEKEDKEMEIQIAAMEQFHALRRELFTTAWRLADEYQFPDEYRLTERQIKQYNEILMDQDTFRKFDRLSDIADKFEAYPPFWYYIGHTANTIAFSEDASREQKDYYTKIAKTYFEKYHDMCRFNLLREDQMVASYALEYADLIMSEHGSIMAKTRAELYDLISLAEKMSGNANDTLELCAIAYMKIGDTKETEHLLRHLVNEDYGTITNAKFLSRFYVNDYITGEDNEKKQEARAFYDTLAIRVNPDYLFPMPTPKQEKASKNINELMETSYINELKKNLTYQYRELIAEIMDKYAQMFRSLLPDNDSWDANPKKCAEVLRTGDFRNKGISLLNKMIDSMDQIDLFTNLPDGDSGNKSRDDCIDLIINKIRASNDEIMDLLDKLKKNSFKKDDLVMLRKYFSFNAYTNEFFETSITAIEKALNNITNLEDLDKADLNMTQVCQHENIPIPPTQSSSKKEMEDDVTQQEGKKDGIPRNLLGINPEKEEQIKKIRDEMCDKVKEYKSKLIKNPKDVNVLIRGEGLFNTYFENKKLSRSEIKDMTIAVIDDVTKKDSDFVLDFYGVRTIINNKVSKICPFDNINLSDDTIKLPWWMTSYSNKAVNIMELYQLIKDLTEESVKLSKI